ncbi:bZIP transcription factor 60 [Euphorbia lathyris]|uniref:bZIP transcription factor 60 n=1 Tax=Euphorbia lathyris TaxID=212925 RepID=UPI0033133C3F
MEDTDFEEDDILGQIDFDSLEHLDFENLFDGSTDISPSVVPESSCLENLSNPSPDSVSSWIGEVENMLMMDDDAGEHSQHFADDFLADLLVDSPPGVSGDVVVDTCTDKETSSSDNGDGGVSLTGKEREKVVNDGADVEKDSEDADDPISKKQRRQLRNRDAAVRSRERKKMHVKDLEMKSKYFEGECRRLGRLLQCCISENQALRLAIQNGNAYGVTSTKQESAVLLLESLLLGSLLWFLGIMCLFNLPILPQSTPVAVLLRNLEKKERERGVGSKPETGSFMKGRRCKAWRRKMEAGPVFGGVLV